MDTNNTGGKYFLPVSVVLAGLFIGGAVLWSNAHPAPAGQQGDTAPKVDVKNVKTDGNPFIGKADAPVTIAFWSDFQCPYCRATEIGGIPQIPTPPAMPEIIKDYVNAGKVRIVFMDFAFLGNDSFDAALYGRAMWKLYPEKYFAWREALLAAQDEENGGFGNAASIDKLNATIAGLDAVKITADVQANKAAYQALADADKAEAVKIGLTGTPAYLVGTTLLPGAYPYADIKAAIEKELAK